jgi:type IV secretion system pilin
MLAALGFSWVGVFAAAGVVQAQFHPCDRSDPNFSQADCDSSLSQSNTPPQANTPLPALCPDGKTPVPINGQCPGGNTNTQKNTPINSTPPSNPPGVPTTGGPALLCDKVSSTTKNGLCLPNNPLGNPTGIAGSGSLTELAAKIIDILLYFAGIVAVIFAIYGGYVYMTSGGNEETATKGRRIITDAIIGLVIVILAYAIITGVSNFILNK